MLRFNSIVRLVCIYALRTVMHILHLFPIKNNRIVINSYIGQQYACSPKYISKKMLEMYPNDFEIIWFFNEPNKYSFLRKDGIKLVRYRSLGHLYYEATARVSINNIGSYSWNPLRRGQEHINTWHAAVDYKKVALSEPRNDYVMKKTLLMTTAETTLFLSACRFFSEKNLIEDFNYKGKVLEAGLPRNDNLYIGNNEKIVDKVKKRYGIHEKDFVVLYAPTWRYDEKNTIPDLNFELLASVIEEKVGRPCTIIYRAHHITGSTGIRKTNVIDVTDYPDSQEILMASDALITDYSSMIWDFSLTKRPCFVYAPDVDTFIHDRGFNIPIEKWGFPICRTNEELISAIKEYEDGKG